MLTRAVIFAAVLSVAACLAPTPTQPAASPAVPEPTPVAPSTPPPTGSVATPAVPASLPPPAQSPAAGPTGSPGPGTDVDAEWRYLADFPAGSAIEVASVTAHAEGFLAVGFEPYPDEGFGGRRNGVVWASADGRSWSRSTPAELASTSLRSVVSLNGMLYAFGKYSICPELSDEEDCTDAPDAGNALWRSEDGAAWQRLALPDSLRGGILDGALTDGRQLIAYGSTGEELVAALWLSPAGEQWTELRELAGVDPINAIEAGGGRLVAFGIRYLFEEDDIETLAGWSEGGAFAQAALPPGQRGVVQDIAWSEEGFVAVGVEDDPSGEGLASVALVSPDGASWTAAPAEQLPANAGFQQVLAVPGGYLAIGAAPAAEAGREEARSWFSPDGLAWQAHATLSGGAYRQLSSSTLGSAGIVVFAADFEASDELEPAELEPGTVHAWFAPLASLP